MFSAPRKAARSRNLAAGLALTLLVAAAGAQGVPSPPAVPANPPADNASRGALLYNTHCVECHNKEKHWRETRQAVDWRSLREQVAAWQARALLGWTDGDVLEVARFLNDTVYHYPRDDGPVRAWGPAAPPEPFAAMRPRLRHGG